MLVTPQQFANDSIFFSVLHFIHLQLSIIFGTSTKQTTVFGYIIAAINSRSLIFSLYIYVKRTKQNVVCHGNKRLQWAQPLYLKTEVLAEVVKNTETGVSFSDKFSHKSSKKKFLHENI